jgi:hypothetical protein
MPEPQRRGRRPAATRRGSNFGGQAGRALHGQRGGRPAAPRSHAPARFGEGVGGLRVRAERGGREMPGTFLACTVPERLGQRAVDSAPLGGRRLLGHRRADQRMTEADPAPLDAQELRVLGCLEQVLVEAQQPERLHDRLYPGRGVERGDQQRDPRVFGQSHRPGPERPLNAVLGRRAFVRSSRTAP